MYSEIMRSHAWFMVSNFFVFRAGRTARAGRAGDVYTILRNDQVRHFKELLRRIDNNYVNQISFDFSSDGSSNDDSPSNGNGHETHSKRARPSGGIDFRPLVSKFQTSLKRLQQIVLLERNGSLRLDAPVPDSQ